MMGRLGLSTTGCFSLPFSFFTRLAWPFSSSRGERQWKLGMASLELSKGPVLEV
jgi:hypothetical protein